MFFLKQSTGQSHPCLITLIVPDYPVLKQKLVVLMLHGWNSGSLLVYNSNYIPLVTCFNLTRKIFKFIPCIIRAWFPTPIFTCIYVNYRRAHGMIFHF